jgi:peptide/nickel transport system substrate-binding protein
MFRNRRRPRLARAAVAGASVLLAVGIAACSGSGNSSSSPSASASATGAKVAGGTATYALPPGVTINYIWPFASITNSSVYNANQFQFLMYRPLYMFGNEGNSVNVNYSLSPANAPVYTNGGKTVTISMKGWKWSNGETVDAKDVIFWLNMMKAEKANYYGYSPGIMPDNLVSYTASGPEQVTIQLDKAYSDLWFTYNQLAEITPMPMAWDVTSASGTPGSGGCATDSAKDKWAKCVAVYTFLAAQAKNASGYASSPVWGVVDGPFKLSSFNSNGNVTIVPNPAYSGSPKPSITALKYVPFTSDATTYTALKTGQIDIAQIPWSDLPQKPLSQALPSTNPLTGYNLQPFYNFGINYIQINFNGPLGAVFKQLYVRQALQELVDQNAMVTAVWRGYGYPTSGPVPSQPASQWVPAIQSANGGQGAYAFNISTAKSLLTSHGWSEVGGVMTCETAAKCGAGVSQGTQLKFNIDYSNGTTEFNNEMAAYKSDASQIGVQISPVAKSFNTVIGESAPCSPGPKCAWNALMYGGWSFNGPGFEPTGESLFSTGSGSNSGSYSNPADDTLINGTHTSSSLTLFHQYATYTAQQAPYIWMPEWYSVQGVNSTLQGVAFNPLWTLLPEYWYFTK